MSTKVMIEQIHTDYSAAHPGFCAVLLRYFNPISDYDAPDGDLPAFRADATKAKELLGREATHAVEDMCKSSWKFARENV